ncbi:putative ribonuclease H-like domain-containing protein [Tanacetum coccineum]
MSQINSECLFFDDTDDETEVNSLLSDFLIDAALVIQASTHTIQKYQRSHMVRDRYGAHDRLVLAYFAKKPFYNAYLFRKRFRMNRSLFTRIVRDLSANCPYFQEGCDAVGKAGISALVKCTFAIRQLAYAAVPDSLDEYLQIGEKTSRDCLMNLCNGVIELYGEEYLRRPTQTNVEKLYAFHEKKHGFPGMIDSIDCTKWSWAQCPQAYRAQFSRGDSGTASFSDATVYAFLSTQPQGSQLVHEDLEQLHDDDLEEMDLKWNMALLSMRARKFYQRTGRKIIIDGSKHLGVKIEDASEKAMCAIDGAGFDWSDMAEEEIQVNMALMALSDSEVTNDKSYDTGFKASTYKRGLSILEGQILKYKESEVLFSEKIALLKRSVGHKEYLMGLLRTELEKVKEEKDGFEFKIAKFEKSAKDLDQLLASQITDKSKKGLEEIKQPELNEYGPRDSSLKPTTSCDKESDNSEENTDDSLKQQQKTDSKTSYVKSPLKVDKDWKEKFFSPANQVREEEPKKARENNDAPIIEDWVSDDEDEVEPIPKVEKKTVIPTATKKEFVKPKKTRLRGQFGFDHIQYNCPKTSHPRTHKHMAPRAVLMKTGLKTVNTARPINTVRSVNTGRPFSTARSFNTVRPSYTAHLKSTVHCARPRTYFQNQAQSTVHRPFYKRTTLM